MGDATTRRLAGWCLVAACTSVEPPASPPLEREPPEREPEATKEVTPSRAVPSSRRCGELGPIPTELPRALARGVERVGSGHVGPSESATFGSVTVKYDPRGWIGTRSTGHRGAVLEALVDRAEVGDGPWGHHDPLAPNRTLSFWLGPYHVHGRTSSEDPPTRVTLAIERRSCPGHAVVDAPSTAAWLWVSTDALRVHTLKGADGDMLQVIVQGHDATPRLEVLRGPWRHALVPAPGRVVALRAHDRTVTIEEVVTGAAEDVAHVHARVRIDPVEPTPLDPPIPAPSACGDAGPTRTVLPTSLAVTPPVREDAHIEVGRTKRVGVLELELTSHTLEPRGWPRTAETHLYLDARGATTMSPTPLTFGAHATPQLARAGVLRVRADPESGKKGPRVRVRLVELACPDRHDIDALVEPTYVWLSTVGHEIVVLGEADRPRATLRLWPDPTAATLSVTTANANLSSAVSPALATRPFSMDDLVVEVTDVLPGPDTHWSSTRWTTTSLVPTLHIQMKLTPAPRSD